MRRGFTIERLFISIYGQTLFVKVLLVLAVVIVTGPHSFVYGPMLKQLAEPIADGDDASSLARRRALQKQSTLLSIINLVLSFAIVLLAAALVA